MQQILAAIGSHAEHNEIDDIDHDLYDWTQVRYFDTAQIQAIKDLGGNITPLLASALKRAFRKDFTVELTAVHQIIASQYKDQSLEANAFLGFQTENQSIHGTLALPQATTQDWATRLLGDASNPDDPQRLSPLEIALLSDVAASLVEAFSACCQDKLVALPPLSMAHMTIPLDDTDELCALAFQFKEAKASEETTRDIILVMPCAQLAQTLEGVARPALPSGDKLVETLQQHVHHVHVTVTVEFARARLTLEQAMDLNAGDVLLLGKALDDPVVLKIDDRPVFYGKPAQCEDHYAVEITQHADY